MFRQAGAMQLSAANLLIASQQLGRSVEQPARATQPQFATALAAETKPGFAPIEFKKPGTEPTLPAAATRPGATPGRLGVQVDIRV